METNVYRSRVETVAYIENDGMLVKAGENFVRKLLVGIVFLAVCYVGYSFFSHPTKPKRMGGENLAPVRVAKVKIQDVPHFLNGLGTVLPSSDVLVTSRVTGHLVRLHFTEGQRVKSGQLLAELDPRPFQAAVNEAKGKLAADSAQLGNAKRDLERYASLVAGDFVERQKYDTQKALVGQYAGAVETDRASLENAKLQLEYSKIKAPTSGITGLRKVDVGNLITAQDATGIVRITEVVPCHVVFTLPETAVGIVLAAKSQGAVPIQAWDRDQKALLAVGELLAVDNEIDAGTGTVKIKAYFANTDRSLYANQFVNIRIRVAVFQSACTVPLSAVQVGAKGSYVFVVKKGDPSTVSLRPIRCQMETAQIVVVKEGLAENELVVVDGIDRLKEGTKVKISATVETAQAEPLQ